MYLELVLILIQLCGIPLNLYYKQKTISSVREYIFVMLTLCIYIPIIEETMFRYAFYHLLEKYISETFYINLINGIVFGLTHIANITVMTFPNAMIFIFHITTNTYLGYYLATIHNDLFLCMIVHALYNFAGCTIRILCNKFTDKNKPGKQTGIFNGIWINKSKLRRCISVNNFGILDELICVDKEKMNKDVLESIEKFKELHKDNDDKMH